MGRVNILNVVFSQMREYEEYAGDDIKGDDTVTVSGMLKGQLSL